MAGVSSTQTSPERTEHREGPRGRRPAASSPCPGLAWAPARGLGSRWSPPAPGRPGRSPGHTQKAGDRPTKPAPNAPPRVCRSGPQRTLTISRLPSSFSWSFRCADTCGDEDDGAGSGETRGGPGLSPPLGLGEAWVGASPSRPRAGGTLAELGLGAGAMALAWSKEQVAIPDPQRGTPWAKRLTQRLPCSQAFGDRTLGGLWGYGEQGLGPVGGQHAQDSRTRPRPLGP